MTFHKNVSVCSYHLVPIPVAALHSCWSDVLSAGAWVCLISLHFVTLRIEERDYLRNFGRLFFLFHSILSSKSTLFLFDSRYSFLLQSAVFFVFWLFPALNGCSHFVAHLKWLSFLFDIVLFIPFLTPRTIYEQPKKRIRKCSTFDRARIVKVTSK